jgi:2-desacetyl-2-hydroxyethyl bacteriochlorophyllide A dehydrogenase
MKAAVCEEPRKIIIKDVQEPRPGEGEVLIKVKSAGISASDVLAYMGLHPDVNYPVILGHELSGEIVAVGREVNDLSEGDEVIVEPLMPCEECQSCISGKYNLCKDMMMLGYNVQGAYAEYVVAKASMVFSKYDSLSYSEAILVEPLARAIHAVKQAGISIGDNVVIIGATSTGLLTLQIAKRAGAVVVITDTVAERLHFAADLDADYALPTDDAKELVMALTKDIGARFVIECTGKPQNLEKSTDLVSKGGTIVMMELIGNRLVQLPLTKIVTDEIKLLGSMTYCRDFPIAIDLADSRAVNLKSIISHEYELSNINEAFENLSEDNDDMIKAVINFPEESGNL